MNCRPVKNPRVKTDFLESGEVILTYPVSPKPWVSGLARRLGWSEKRYWTKKLQLDELGTTVWNLLDGEKTVYRVIREFTDKYRLLPKEAELSVSRFLMELGKRGIIGLR